MIDFTTSKYTKLLDALIDNKYSFQTFSEYLINPKSKVVILRHDVDLLPVNSLEFARIQKSRGVKGVYYFRNTNGSWDESIVKEISLLGHEIGYHYETMDTCNGNIDKAYEEFKSILKKFREIVSIKTICMHGSPRSPFDNRAIWGKYDFKQLDLIGEPYFDLDFDKVFYATDTGRMWNGSKYSVRDKVNSNINFPTFNSTDEMIMSLREGDFPSVVMLNFHPQRWTHNMLFWSKEYISQKIKNLIKRTLFVKSKM